MKKLKELFTSSFIAYLAIELVEETIEELITIGISSLIVKMFSTFLVVLTSQLGKRFIKALVKLVIYKEGNDKVNKIKSFFKWVWANKKTLIGTIGGVFSGIATAVATNSDAILALPELLVFNFNITPILSGVLVFAGVEIGVIGKGFELLSQWQKRKEAEAEEKEIKLATKTAKKEIANEEKLANQTQAENEKAEIKEAAARKAEEEKEKAEKAFREKVEAIKSDLKKAKKEESLKSETTN